MDHNGKEDGWKKVNYKRKVAYNYQKKNKWDEAKGKRSMGESGNSETTFFFT